jgi:hypothetical protein
VVVVSPAVVAVVDAVEVAVVVASVAEPTLSSPQAVRAAARARGSGRGERVRFIRFSEGLWDRAIVPGHAPEHHASERAGERACGRA